MSKTRKIDTATRKNWDYLVTHFSPDYIENMTDMKEYVVGFGSGNKSFCYLVEAGTIELGDIRGSASSKFGLWFGTHGNDKEPKYRAIKRNFDGDVNKAFSEIKKALAKLIRETQNLNEFTELKSILSDIFKYKVMYLYNPGLMIPSFVLEDLQYFEERLGLGVSKTFENAQKKLVRYRDENLPQLDNHNFMVYLYKTFGRSNIVQTKEINENADNELNKKILAVKEPTFDYVTHPVEKSQVKKSKQGYIYYPRDPKMAAIALKNAKHKCEYNNDHECFIRKSTNLPYTEVHHLIPLAYHYKFAKSLDVPENIVSLCSNCHNEIHYGKNADKLIEMLFIERKEQLRAAGIEITLKELLDMYHRIGEHK